MTSQRWTFHCSLDTAHEVVCAFARYEAQGLVMHSLRWAHIDQEDGFSVGESWLDSVELLRHVTEADQAMDPAARTAIVEALVDGDPIGPDQLLPGPVVVGERELDFGGIGTARLLGPDSWEIAVNGENGCFRLVFTGTTVHGTVQQLGAEAAEVSGTGWFEHTLDARWYRSSWERVLVRLDNGVEISPSSMTTGDPWTSPSTLHTYPTRFEISAPDLDIVVRARTPYPELESMVPGVQVFTANAEVSGTLRGQSVSGTAFIDLLPDSGVDDLESYPQRLNPLVQEQISSVYPDSLSLSAAADMIGVDESELDGVSPEVLQRSLIAPVRYVSDSGGKRWRAFAAYGMARTRGVRGQDVIPGIALVELLHSAVLAIDDVEDGSPRRRGRPAAHEVFGVAETINASYALTFTLDRLAAAQERGNTTDLPESATSLRARLSYYEAFMKVARALHVGQALDLAGHTEAMDEAVRTGDPSPVLRAILATHRFKTANVFRYVAETALRAVDGEDPDAGPLGDYLEAVGLALQITDDVLDLSGVPGPDASGRHRQLKRECEDLRAGKVTMPLAHAVHLLPRDRMRRLWESVRGGRADEAAVREAVRVLRECGAVEACYAEAESIVDRTWRGLAGIPVTYHKVLLRAAGIHLASRRGADSVT
ncbi:polyprenyl synthetase family protein [Allokutzneria albata]|uniref:Geranylgeranyl pyrophosphate synthase n=1 Tax=Allokutzneria albata TaxID=211114 RepID=A0A1G9S611_ALLAB|nr:polyprenyl synthetase family protein [Allokutzneria albata]SDM30195.1 Geranylgeranyl pyrophosphate synthase [Allokutzneria albata]